MKLMKVTLAAASILCVAVAIEVRHWLLSPMFVYVSFDLWRTIRK